MKLILLLTMFFAVSDHNYQLQRTLPLNAIDNVFIDKLENFYTVKDDVLRKYYSSGIIISTFSDKAAGPMQSIDPSNPMKVLVLYSVIGKLKILDSKLAPQAEYNLRDFNIIQPKLVCNSYNNGFWLYDQQDFRLKRFDNVLKVTNESQNIGLVQSNIQPDYMIEEGNYVFLKDAENILLFDLYGNYVKSVAVKAKFFQVIENELLVYTKDNQMKQFNLITGAEKNILFPEVKTEILNFYLTGKKLYVFSKEQLDLYSF